MAHRLSLLSFAALLPALLLPTAAVAQADADAARRREAVERSLTPAVLLEGRRPTEWTLRQRMARYNVPGVSIALVRDGSIEWTAGYGSSGGVGPRPVTTATRFQAASLSKPVAALLTLKLVQEGRLDLDANVDRYLRSWRIPDNAHTATRPITLRDLLSHRAGVNVAGFPGYAQSESLPTLLQLLDGSGPSNSPPIRVDAVPGSEYRYSGGGYQILQLIIEDVMGQRFEDLARDLVFEPLGMDASTFAVAPTNDNHPAAVAAGHDYAGEPVFGGWHRYPEQAAASLWSTPEDLAKFVIAVMRAYTGADDAILDQRLATQMLSPQSGSVGLGPGVHGNGIGLHFDHAGWNRGFRAYLLGYPATGDGVVVMVNGDGGDILISEILRSVAQVYAWPDFRPEMRSVAALSRSTLASYAGVYEVPEYQLTITIRADEDHLLLSTPRGSRYTFFPSSESTFFSIEDGSSLEVVRREGAADELRLWGMVARRRPPRHP